MKFTKTKIFTKNNINILIVRLFGKLWYIKNDFISLNSTQCYTYICFICYIYFAFLLLNFEKTWTSILFLTFDFFCDFDFVYIYILTSDLYIFLKLQFRTFCDEYFLPSPILLYSMWRFDILDTFRDAHFFHDRFSNTYAIFCDIFMMSLW